MTPESFLAGIDDFLKSTGMSPTAFGKSAVGDPNLVSDLRGGRMPSLRLVGRVDAFMRSQRESAEATQ